MKPLEELEKEALSVRRDIIEMLYRSGSGHPGGALSAVEILVYLYNHPGRGGRLWDGIKEQGDRVVLSKGHGAPALYAVLAEHGFFSKDEFKRLRKIRSMLQGHPDRNKTPGVEVCTGSLGIGASAAFGLAMGDRFLKRNGYVYGVLGDGELQEGIVWEAFTASVHYGMDHLIYIVDRNGLQIDGPTEKVMRLGDLMAKLKAFGFDAAETDGHDFTCLDRTLEALKSRRDKRPKCVIANTVKGKGIPFMENNPSWHGKRIGREDYEGAMKALKGGL